MTATVIPLPSSQDIAPLRPFYPSSIEGVPPAPVWLVDGFLLPGMVGLLAGAPKAGKSLLLQQLLISCGLGQPWLGHATEQARGFGLFCEDGADWLTRRALAICEHHDVHQSVLDREVSWVAKDAQDATLWEVDPKTGRGSPTFLWQQLWGLVAEDSVRVLVLDTAAVVFAGNENFRNQVTPFLRALSAMAVVHECAVILSAHTPKAGRGASGSTAWLGSVRQGMGLEMPRDWDDEAPTSERMLRSLGGNYTGMQGPERIRWERGVFVLDELAAAERRAPEISDIDLRYRLLIGLRRAMQHGVLVPADVLAAKSLPSLARSSAYSDIRGVPLNLLYRAQEALLAVGQAVLVRVGQRCLIRPADMTYQGEEAWSV